MYIDHTASLNTIVMKRGMWVVPCLLVAMVFLESAYAQKTPEKPPVLKSGEYTSFSFPALKTDEHLSYQFVQGDSVTLKLFAEAATQSERKLIGTWEDFSWLGKAGVCEEPSIVFLPRRPDL